MAEWLVEHGIGEKRALLVERGEVMAAKLRWPGELHSGQQHFARLVSKPKGRRRGIAALEDGTEILVDHLPPDAHEGATIGIRITRAPIAERGRHKLAQARCFVVGSEMAGSESKVAPPASDEVFTLGDTVRRFPSGLWEEVWSAASSGILEFSGGHILISTTPAMTLIDIDGDGAPRDLAVAALPAIARAIRWFDLGGSIGIDFPTIQTKSDRKAVDDALAEALSDWPHERTAMNGFGFVQIVARLEGPSLLHRFAISRTGMCARMALRRAEMVDGAGASLLTVHPAIKAKLKLEWLDELARRTGKEVRIETDPSLALEASQAQIVER